MKTPALLLALLLLGAAGASARMQNGIDLSVDAQASITIGSCFDNVDFDGYAPIDVTINNHSGQTRRWDIHFTSPAWGSTDNDSLQSSFSVTVENNGTRTVTLMVPVIGGKYSVPLSVTAEGYGVVDGARTMLGQYQSSGKTQTRFAAISESLGTSIWSSLSSQIGSDGLQLAGSTFNPDELPEDWRGLSGVAALWLSGEELNHLDPAQRQAVRDWVRLGGQLFICGVSEKPSDFQFNGFGQASALPAAALDINATKNTIENLPTTSEPGFDSSLAQQYTKAEAVKPNVPLLGSFMALFAITVGPVNVFAFAGRRRQRLFWTTPLISVAASALLMGVIVVQDGMGGHGGRRAVVCVFPDTHEQAVVQMQDSRTGMLLGATFRLRDPARIDQLTETPADQGRALATDGAVFSGGWFTSRAAQTQSLFAITPTRAEITLMNPADVANGAAPVIVSSFDTTLDDLYFTDARHQLWHAKEVRTGQKITMEPPTDKDGGIDIPAGPTGPLHEFVTQPGSFIAIASQSSDYIPTLDSIRWSDDPVTYIGPVTNSP
jgi:hypothetical protein